jgi:SNF2 family DNA or RNA helicase
MLIAKKHKKLVLNLRDPERVTTVIPTAKLLDWRGHQLVAVPHKLDEVRVLRNMGFDAPSPMGSYYDWPGRYNPFEHQRITSEFLTLNERAFVLNGMGSGKTMSVLWAFDYLRRLGHVNSMLIVSPLSTLERAWGDEIFRHFPELSFAVLHGTRERRHKLLASPFDIYIINHDGIRARETVDRIAERDDIDIVVVDEVASFRNSQTERWKAANLLINGNKKTEAGRKRWAWGLTGTPTPNAPTDAWAQVKLINPGKAPGYFTGFRETVMQPQGPYKWTMRAGALDVVRNIMQPAVRFAREDCIDLPPTTYVTRDAQLTPEQQKAFDAMLRQLKAEHDGGEITAINEAVKLSKLLQICCGLAYGTAGEVALPCLPRMDLVDEIIQEADAKVIVFVPLTGALKTLAGYLRKQGHAVAVVNGETSKNERDTIFRDFQQAPNPRVLVANAGTMSHGLTLTAANTVVWYAPVHSLETYEQACARVTRPGQKRNTLIVNIESTPLERKIYERLQGRGKTQGLLLEMIKNMR